jgi:hypothetical protein
MIRSRRNRRAEARIRNQIAGSSSKNEGTKLYCAGGYGSWRIKLSNYLLRPNLAGCASSDGERAGSLSSRNIGISSRRDLKRQFSTDHILPGLRQAAVAFGGKLSTAPPLIYLVIALCGRRAESCKAALKDKTNTSD